MIGIIISVVCEYKDAINHGGFMQNFISLFDYVISIVVFVIFKYLFVNYFQDLEKITYWKDCAVYWLNDSRNIYF